MTMHQLSAVMLTVLERVEERLTEPVGLSSLSPGLETVWDDCCNGQLWVRLVAVQPMMDTAAQRGVPQNAGLLGWLVDLAIGTARCVISLQEDGSPPTADQMTTDAQAEVQDMEDIRDALLCNMDGIPNLIRPTLVTWAPLGPLGGCVGGEWQFRFLLRYCGC